MVFEEGVSHFKRKFQGKGVVRQDFWRQKTRVPGVSRDVVCVILRLAVLIQYRRVTHRRTDRQTHTDGHTMMANTRARRIASAAAARVETT